MRSFVLAALIGMLLAGCGGDDDTASVRSLFARLDAAQERGDAEAACERVFLVAEEGRTEPEAEEEEGEEGEREAGESPEACRAAFRAQSSTRAAQVRRLRTTVTSVEVHGEEAIAKVRSEVTRADGSRFTNVYQRDLVRRDSGWRIRISPEG